MSATHQVCSAPFDAVAAQYDEIFTSSRIGRAQRASVWRELEKAFHPGDRVLEIGCGTGVDACFLARRGVQVLASDSSPQMIAVALRRVQEERLQHLVQPIVLRAEDIATLPAHSLFDGVFSNFGAINCIEDLRTLAVTLYERLNPGAKVLLCPFGPCCMWELAWFLVHGQPRKAFRRMGSQNTARIAGGNPVRICYPTVRSLKRIFAPEFRLTSSKGIGVLIPPSYAESWADRFPWLLSLAVKTDTGIEHWPGLRDLADHILLTLERRAE
jgi:ubiquinone/menaquinone biosynthesis C-methylase UbiE